MSKHRDDIVLKDIANAAQQIILFVDGFGRETFVDDWKTATKDIPTLLEEIEQIQE